MIKSIGRLGNIALATVALAFLVSFARPLRSPLPETERTMTNDDLMQVRHVSVSIARPADEVYRFAAKPENMPRWAAGLGKSFHPRPDGTWVAEGGPVGSATVRFVERNRFGVLDHDVTVPSGETVHNPIRVIPNGDGSEVVFTLFRQPGVSAAQFSKDASTVEQDLRTLKRLLEADR
jgi:HAMP domain-containing protein